MAFTFLGVDDVTPATALVLGPTAAGATSATTTIHGWYNILIAGGSITNVSIQAVSPTTGLDSGEIWLDETWIEARVNGGANPSDDPRFVKQTTDWFKLGAGSVLPVGDLYGDCAHYIELRLHPPLKDGTPTQVVNFKLIANYNESALSLSGGLADLGQGIITGLGDLTVTEFVTAPTVLATGTPDAVVHVGPSWYMYRGVSVKKTTTDDLTLNQNDSASAALTTGHEYTAVISQPATGAAVATKGLLAVTGASDPPAMPAGNLLLAQVIVPYHVTASVIANSDIAINATDGRGTPSIGTGLHVNVAPVRAILSGGRIINRSAQAVLVTGNASPITSYIWLGSDGVLTAVPTSTEPPFAGALLICSCVANATTVTSVTDLRVYLGAKRAPGLTAYANNAAAIAGGLGPGDLFRTSADPSVVCVVT